MVSKESSGTRIHRSSMAANRLYVGDQYIEPVKQASASKREVQQRVRRVES